ncbi:MAG: LysR family transcriptional regulator [Bradymonadia bacterium]
MDWNDVRYFLALARLGAVRAAGKSLGVSHSTVARRVEALEAELGTRLFDRHRDGYMLTEAGEQMLPRAERIEGEMAALERGLVGQDERLSGPVNITCSDHIIARLLLPELEALSRQYPEIEVHFSVDSRSFDLSRREADIAIRTLVVDDQPPPHLIGRKVAPLVIANYVALDHAERLDPEIVGPQATRWLSFEPRKAHEGIITQSDYADVAPWGTFTTMELTLEAALVGLGLAMLPTYVGDPHPGLRRLRHPGLWHLADIWLISHPDLRDNARFRAVRACIANCLKLHRGLFEGEGWFTDGTEGPENAPGG